MVVECHESTNEGSIHMKRRGTKRILSSLIIVALLFGSIVIPRRGYKAIAATTTAKIEDTKIETTKTSSYITVEGFIKKLVVAMNLEVDTSQSLPYIKAAYSAGILKDDFENFDVLITKTDAAVLLDRADEYLHGETLTDSFVEKIINKRISDIKKIEKSKREAVASVYGKGIITGYTNGAYSQNREFRGDNYVAKSTADKYINLAVNTKGRAVISRDGQLTRTKNLPKNSDKYEYILASFPNKYYEGKFAFQYLNEWNAEKGFVEGNTLYTNYWYPEHTIKASYKTVFTEIPMTDMVDMYLDTWMERTETYVHNLLNVDYRTIGDDWVNDMVASSVRLGESSTKNYKIMLNDYISNMKKYRVVIKTNKLAVDSSSLYKSTKGWYVRVYVKYKVNATEIPKKHHYLIFSSIYTHIEELTLNQWMDGYFDIMLDDASGFNGDGSDIAPSSSNAIYDCVKSKKL